MRRLARTDCTGLRPAALHSSGRSNSAQRSSSSSSVRQRQILWHVPSLSSPSLSVRRPLSGCASRSLSSSSSSLPSQRSSSPFALTGCCWQCSDLLPSAASLYCPSCGLPQLSALRLDYFSLLSLPQSFDVSSALLAAAHRRLQQKLHPDRFAAAGPQARLVSAQLSAAVNAAYACLLSPLSRARYLLSLHSQLQDEEAVVQQQQQPEHEQGQAELLAEVLSLREELESIALSGDSAASRLRLAAVAAAVRQRETRLLSRLSSALQAHDWGQARPLVDELSFFSSLTEQCRQMQPLS